MAIKCQIKPSISQQLLVLWSMLLKYAILIAIYIYFFGLGFHSMKGATGKLIGEVLMRL